MNDKLTAKDKMIEGLLNNIDRLSDILEEKNSRIDHLLQDNTELRDDNEYFRYQNGFLSERLISSKKKIERVQKITNRIASDLERLGDTDPWDWDSAESETDL